MAIAAGMGTGVDIELVGNWELGVGSWEFSLDSPLRTPHSTLPLQADAEAEDLRVVGVGFGDREGEVQRDRGRAHCRDGDSQAQTWRGAEIIQRDILVDCAEIDECHAVDHVVCGEWEQVFDCVEEFEVATNLNVANDRRRTAEIEAAERGKAAGVEGIVNRRVVACESNLRCEC